MRRELLKRLSSTAAHLASHSSTTVAASARRSVIRNVLVRNQHARKRFIQSTTTTLSSASAAAAEEDLKTIESELKSACDERVSSQKPINWIVLGMPGVGKGTYAKILSKTMDIEHVSAGDLVREEIATASELGQKMQKIVNEGQLLPDEMVVDAVIKKITTPKTKASERGFLLDGFPRTIAQAEKLSETVPVDVVLNFTLEEAILVEKACARRKCGECGKGYNVADIDYTTKSGMRIIMPPLSPPEKCVGKMTMRDDDKEETVRARLEAFKKQSLPVEDWYRKKSMLSEFEILGGIPETTPRLMRFCLEQMKKSSA
jgi:adenylate kinase